MAKKKFDYYNYFTMCAEAASEAAQHLQRSFADFDPALVPKQLEEMHRIENDADRLKHEMLRHLTHEFMMPIELEDIIALSQELDDVVDSIDDVMQRLNMYLAQIGQLRSEALLFTPLIVKACELLVSALREFRDFKRSKTILSLLVEINTIESEGDVLYAKCMKRLFSEETDVLLVVVWSTMFDFLERCLDDCEDVADVMERVIMKNT